MNPLEAGARFIGGMAGLPTIDLRKSFFNPWNMFPKKPQPQKGLPKPESSRLPTRALPPSTVDAVVSKPQKPQPVQAPKPAWKPVGTTTVQPSQTPQQPKAPAPQWGGSQQAQDIKRLNQLTKGPIGDKTIAKPVVSSGRMGAPQGPALSTNVAPKPQFATSMGQAPKPAWNTPKPPAAKPNRRGGLLGLATLAASILDGGPVADGTLQGALKRGDYKPVQGPPVPKAPEKKVETPEREKITPRVKRPEPPKPVDSRLQKYRDLIKQGKHGAAKELGKQIHADRYGIPTTKTT